MAQRGKKHVGLAQWQAKCIRRMVRLAERYGQYPSARELSAALGCSQKWATCVLRSMREDGLAVNIGRGLSAGWMPTPEALRWCELPAPTLGASSAPPRSVRAQGIGSVRAWNSKQRTRARLAAFEVFDRDADAPPGSDALEA